MEYKVKMPPGPFMGKQILLYAIFATVVLCVNSPAQKPEGVPTAVIPERPVVARVYFTGQGELDVLLPRLDVWEVHYKDGYLVAALTPPRYEELSEEGYRVEIDEEKSELLRRPLRLLGVPPGYPCYRTVEETYAAMETLASDYPDLASLIDIGNSWEKVTPGGNEGYDLKALVLGNKNVSGAKPRFFLMAEIHAREMATAELASRFAEYLLANYDTNPDVTWALDYFEIHIMPMVNPDGRKIAEQGYYHRKNTNNSNGGSCETDPDDPSYVYDHYGTDLNRNSSFHWGGASNYQCDQQYQGPSAASDPETQAIQDYVRTIFQDQRGPNDNDPAPDDATGVLITLHSYQSWVMWPWGWTENAAPNSYPLRTLGRKLAYFNSYNAAQSYELYHSPITGATEDWAYGELGVAAYTFEIGTAFFQDCESFESTIYPKNREALMYAFKAARRPYQNPAGPESLNVAVPTATVVAGTPVDLSATADDTRYREGETLHSIAGARYSVDNPSWIEGTDCHPMTAADGNFDSPIENMRATVDTTGWRPGRHIIFVESRDTADHDGVPGAVFVWISGLSPWAMFRHDAARTGLSSYVGPGTGVLKWSYRTGNNVDSSCAIDWSGNGYVGSDDNTVYALDATGSLLWSYATANNLFSSPGISSERRVYFGSMDNRIYALGSGGAVDWSYETGDDSDSSCGIGSGGTIYVGSRDNTIYSLMSVGCLSWSYSTSEDITSSPTIGSDGDVIVGSFDNTLYAFMDRGSLSWSYETGGDIHISSPARGPGGMVSVGSLDGGVYACDAAGSLAWSYATGGSVESSPSVNADGNVCVGSDDNSFYSFDSAGSLRWSYKTGGSVLSSPALDNEGRAFIGSYDSRIYALTVAGSLEWSYQMESYTRSSPSLNHYGDVYVGSADHRLYVFEGPPTPTPTSTHTPTNTATATPTSPPTSTPTVTPTPPLWWDGDWPYRRLLTLNPVTSTAYYQVRVELTTTLMGNPYTHINMNGSDIRFTGPDGTTLQDYWIERWNSTGSSTLWVEVKDAGASKIYIYYGNASAQSESNGDATFEFFDDFEGSEINSDKWTLTFDSGATASIVDGALRLRASSPSNGWIVGSAKSKIPYSRPCAVSIKIRNVAQDATWSFMRPIEFLDDEAGNNHWGLEDYSNASYKKYRKIIGGVSTWIGNISYIWGSSWHTLEAVMTYATNKFYFDGGLDATDTTDFIPASGVLNLRACMYYAGTVSEKYFDNVVVRKYIDPEPAAGVGSEEGIVHTATPTATVTPTLTPTCTATPTGTPTATPTATLTPSPTPTRTAAPPLITNISRDEARGDITLAWTGSCDVDVYSAVDMQSAFNIAQGNVSGGTWTDDGTWTGGHPNGVSERYYKISCAGTSQYASDAVGMFRYALAVGYNLICLPVIPYDNDIDVVFGTQLTEGSSVTGDRIYTQDPDYGSLMKYAYLSSSFHEWKGSLDEALIVPEKGYFLQIRTGHIRLTQYVVGKVASGDVEMPEFVIGYSMIGSVWPVDVNFNLSNLKESGANAGSLLTSDQVYSQAGSGYGGSLDYGWLSSSDGMWKGTLSDFRRGYGCWYRIDSDESPFRWYNVKPYADPPY
ncbi:MAG: DUF2341 domain-containing protein [Candidatus Aureabacteria bacterium]|nr:DUF2341 domain-containing protein [Candidatus Auribacterota bacterium]